MEIQSSEMQKIACEFAQIVNLDYHFSPEKVFHKDVQLYFRAVIGHRISPSKLEQAEEVAKKFCIRYEIDESQIYKAMDFLAALYLSKNSSIKIPQKLLETPN